MDIQELIDGISLILQDVRKDYHLNLGELIAILGSLDDDTVVVFDHGGYPDEFDSYRGYYSDLSISSSGNKSLSTAKGLLEKCGQALGSTFTGYKGGDFFMESSTPLWSSQYGDTGKAIVGINTNEDGSLILITKQVD